MLICDMRLKLNCSLPAVYKPLCFCRICAMRSGRSWPTQAFAMTAILCLSPEWAELSHFQRRRRHPAVTQFIKTSFTTSPRPIRPASASSPCSSAWSRSSPATCRREGRWASIRSSPSATTSATDHTDNTDRVYEMSSQTYPRGFAPRNSPTRALARRWRRRGPIAWLTRYARSRS